jgi:predicted nucleic acid-binding protein
MVSVQNKSQSSKIQVQATGSLGKSIVFDTGPIISLSTNNLLWILEELKKKYGGEFYITKRVKSELIDKPFETKKFRFEAIQVLDLISRDVLKIYDSVEANSRADKVLDLSNNCLTAKNNFIKIMHPAEAQVVGAALELNSDTIVVDETATRYLIEGTERIVKRLENKFHSKIMVNKENISKLRAEFKNLHVIRSFELAIIAYELGLFDKYSIGISPKLVPGVKDLRSEVLPGILWALKLNGCSVKEQDISDAIQLESMRKKK